MKVLVVDDDVVSRMVLMHLVDSCGSFDIVEAEDGADAWQQLQGGLRPAICFCDLRMPRLSGMELLARVKADPQLQAMPLVLVSSATDQETVRQAAQSGAAGYIVKPFQAEQVRQYLGAGLGSTADADADAAEAPQLTQQRLGINAERLLVYLAGFQNQLGAASTELDALLARGEHDEARRRLERLHIGCVTLGLHCAARELATLLAAPEGALASAPLQALLADVVRGVVRQSAQVRQQL